MDETRAPEILPLTGLRPSSRGGWSSFHFGRDLVPPPSRAWPPAGHVAVDVFFVLSGYLLARRYAAVDLGSTRDARRAFGAAAPRGDLRRAPPRGSFAAHAWLEEPMRRAASWFGREVSVRRRDA